MKQKDIHAHYFHSEQPGPRLLVFGAIHGNEPAGSEAINAIKELFESKQISLINGSVTLVPVANPDAYKASKRFLEEDLNRVFKDTINPKSYEAKLANELGVLIKECDIFLDIHTTSAAGPTCVFIDFPTPNNIAYAEVLGMDYSISGWPELYAQNPNGFDSYDTTRYAFEHKKTGLIIECGQHEELIAIDIAKQSILRTLAYFGMIDPQFVLPSVAVKTKPILMKRLEYKSDDNDSFAKKWKHLEPIIKDTLIAIRTNGDEIITSEDCVMLLPKHTAKAGQEWFYLGIEKENVYKF